MKKARLFFAALIAASLAFTSCGVLNNQDDDTLEEMRVEEATSNSSIEGEGDGSGSGHNPPPGSN